MNVRFVLAGLMVLLSVVIAKEIGNVKVKEIQIADLKPEDLSRGPRNARSPSKTPEGPDGYAPNTRSTDRTDLIKNGAEKEPEWPPNPRSTGTKRGLRNARSPSKTPEGPDGYAPNTRSTDRTDLIKNGAEKEPEWPPNPRSTATKRGLRNARSPSKTPEGPDGYAPNTRSTDRTDLIKNGAEKEPEWPPNPRNVDRKYIIKNAPGPE